MAVIARDGRDSTIYHVAGAWKVRLSKMEQVQALAFLGAPFIPDANGDWLDAFATTQHATEDPDTLTGKTAEQIAALVADESARRLSVKG